MLKLRFLLKIFLLLLALVCYAGAVPSDFYYIDMIKVGGYVSENDNYY